VTELAHTCKAWPAALFPVTWSTRSDKIAYSIYIREQTKQK